MIKEEEYYELMNDDKDMPWSTASVTNESPLPKPDHSCWENRDKAHYEKTALVLCMHCKEELPF